MYTILFDEAEERGEKRGERRGEIIGVIKFCHDELHLPLTEIVKKIMPRFDLKKDEAEKYVAEVLNLDLV